MRKPTSIMASKQETQNKIDLAVTTDHAPEVQYSGAKSMPFIIGNETCEKLGSIGVTNNLLVYLTTVFNLKAITATTLVNIFNGTSNFASLPGAILSDTYFGRYQTLAFASVASFIGLLILTLTAAVTKLHPSDCSESLKIKGTCPGPSPWQMAILVSGLGLLVIGAGGIRPCNLAFGADQFNPNTESGKKGINMFFNWYYFGLTFGMMVSFTLIAYVGSDLNWSWGLAIPTFLMLSSCVLFFTGSRIYVKVKPNGSPLTGVARVVVAAVKKRGLKSPEQPWQTLFNHFPITSFNSKLPYTDQFRFLNKAAIIDHEDTINPDGTAANPWRLCSMQQVEEVKCLMRIIPILASAIIYYIAMIQQQTSVVFQALQSDRRLGNSDFKVPAITYLVFTTLSIIIWIPIYDRIIVPTLRRFTGKESGITVLQRIAFGMVLAILAMIISALVEQKRRSLALTNPIGMDPRRGEISSLSGFWLVPQLTLTGFSEAFTVIGHIEFYYKQCPENMRSISGSFFYIGLAVSNYLNGFLISVVHHVTRTKSGKGDWLPEDLNKGRLDRFYYLVAALEVINLGYFIMCAKWYKYKGTTTNTTEVDLKNMQSEKPLV